MIKYENNVYRVVDYIANLPDMSDEVAIQVAVDNLSLSLSLLYLLLEGDEADKVINQSLDIVDEVVELGKVFGFDVDA